MQPIPIQDLTPETSPPADRVIKAIVTLLWPYSSSTKQCALLLADPDFRLRSRKGQVRVRFTGPSASAIAKAHIRIGDEVILDLSGASWAEDGGLTRTPGRSVDGELKYGRKLALRIAGDGAPVEISVDVPTPPGSPERRTEAAVTPLPKPAANLRSSSAGTLGSIPIYSSPAFVKRSRLSGESLLNGVYDLLADADLDAYQPRKKLRISFADVPSWRYAERTPSLGKDRSQDTKDRAGDIEMIDGVSASGSGTSSAGSDEDGTIGKDIQETHALLARPRQLEDRLPKESRHGLSDAVDGPSKQLSATVMPPPPLPHLQMLSNPSSPSLDEVLVTYADDQEGPRTPRLQPISSAALPLPSPFPTDSAQQPFPALSAESIAQVARDSSPIVAKGEHNALRMIRAQEIPDTYAVEEALTSSPTRADSDVDREPLDEVAPDDEDDLYGFDRPLPSQAVWEKVPIGEAEGDPIQELVRSDDEELATSTVRDDDDATIDDFASIAHEHDVEEVYDPEDMEDQEPSDTDTVDESEDGYARKEKSPTAVPFTRQPSESNETDREQRVSSLQQTDEPSTTQTQTPVRPQQLQPLTGFGLDGTVAPPPPKQVSTGTATAATPAVAQQTTPQAERDRIMKRTFQSLFGFRGTPSPTKQQPSMDFPSPPPHAPEPEPSSPVSTDADVTKELDAAELPREPLIASSIQGGPTGSPVRLESVPPVLSQPLPSSARPPAPVIIDLGSSSDVDEDELEEQAAAQHEGLGVREYAQTEEPIDDELPAAVSEVEDKHGHSSPHGAMDREGLGETQPLRLDQSTEAEKPTSAVERAESPIETSHDAVEPEYLAHDGDDMPMEEDAHYSPSDSGRLTVPDSATFEPSLQADHEAITNARPVDDTSQPPSAVSSFQQLSPTPEYSQEWAPQEAAVERLDLSQVEPGDWSQLSQLTQSQALPAQTQRLALPAIVIADSVASPQTSLVAESSRPSTRDSGHVHADTPRAQAMAADLANVWPDLGAIKSSQELDPLSGQPEKEARETTTQQDSVSPHRADQVQVVPSPQNQQSSPRRTACITVVDISASPPAEANAEVLKVSEDDKLLAEYVDDEHLTTNDAVSQSGQSVSQARGLALGAAASSAAELGAEHAALAPETDMEESQEVTTRCESSDADCNVPTTESAQFETQVPLAEPERSIHPSLPMSPSFSQSQLEQLHAPAMAAESAQFETQVLFQDSERSLYPPLPMSPSLSQSQPEQLQAPSQAEPSVGITGSILPPTPQLTQVESTTQVLEVMAHETEGQTQSMTPTRRSLKSRLSNVPDVISTWFSPKRSSGFILETSTAEEPHEHTAHGSQSLSNGATAPITNGNATDEHQAIATRSWTRRTGLFTPMGYFTPLASLGRQLNPSSQQAYGSNFVDVLAVVTGETKAPKKAKLGPRDFYTVLHITDSSLSGKDVQVEVFRPWKAFLPVAEVGDVVLLRAFVVKSRQGGPYLLSTDASAWCVWRFAEVGDTREDGGKPICAHRRPSSDGSGCREEVKGPPVEFGGHERKQAHHLRTWWLKNHKVAGEEAASSDAVINGNAPQGVTTELQLV